MSDRPLDKSLTQLLLAARSFAGAEMVNALIETSQRWLDEGRHPRAAIIAGLVHVVDTLERNGFPEVDLAPIRNYIGSLSLN